MRRKRLAALVKKECSKKLKLKRATRFNSALDVVNSFLQAVEKIRGVMAADTWPLLVQSSRCKRGEEHGRLWGRKPLLARLQRAQSILQVLAKTTRFFGKRRLPDAYATWCAFRCELEQVVGKLDFVDVSVGETDETKRVRREALVHILVKRQAKHLDGVNTGAMAFDPRFLSVLAGCNCPRWLPEAWQDAVSACTNKLVLSVHAEGRGVFLRQFHAYATHSGDFEDIQYPSEDADAAEVWSWWQCKQPAAFLGKLALRLWCMPCSQGASERSWARLGRQVQPVRSRLGATSKRKLMFVSTNYVLLPTFRAVNGNDEDGHGACKRQKVAVPGKEMAAPAPVEAELVEEAYGEDEYGTDSSISSGSSCSSTDSD